MLDLLAIATTTAATLPTTLPATMPTVAPTVAAAAPAAGDLFGMSGPVLAALIAAGTSAVVALLNLRYQSVATRLKTYLEAYKVAKDAGLATAADEKWARNVLRTIHNDIMVKPDSDPFEWVYRLLLFVLFIVALTYGAIRRWPSNGYLYAASLSMGGLLTLRVFHDSYRRHRQKSLIAPYPSDQEAEQAKRL